MAETTFVQSDPQQFAYRVWFINKLHNRSITFSEWIRTLWKFMQRSRIWLNIREFMLNIQWVFSVQRQCHFFFFNFYKYHEKKLINNPNCQLDIVPPKTKLKVEGSRWPIDSPKMSKSIRVDDLLLPSFPPFVEEARKRIKEIENFLTRKDDLLCSYSKSGNRYI